MGKMDPAPEEKWSGQTNDSKERLDGGQRNGQTQDKISRQSNPEGKGLNPGQKGPAQPTPER